jgi:antirestriction protein ArdC
MEKQEKKEWAMDKAKDLRAKLDTLLDETMIDRDKMRALMDHYKINGLYNYSFLNSVMVYAQGGHLVQSFKKWQEFERYVRKGEKAHIYIFVPAFAKKEAENGEEEDKTVAFFLLKPVFDVTQTEGKPLEYAHNSAETAAYSFDDLAGKISTLTGLPVNVKPTGEARGYCSLQEIAISESSNNTDKIKTLFHEAAHALFNHHKAADKGRDVREVEAEAAAYLLLSFLGIDYELSGEYVRSWHADRENINKTEILKIADRLIKAVQIAQEVAEAA